MSLKSKTLSQALKHLRGRSKKVAATSANFDFTLTDPTTLQKNTFQAFVTNVHNEEDVINALEYIYTHKSLAKATHNMFAYVYDSPKGPVTHCDDDGETGAGKYVLNTLTGHNGKNCFVNVSRFYTGVLMGPSRFRAISKIAADGLQEAGYKNTGVQDNGEDSE